jgi:hypothetical protein
MVAQDSRLTERETAVTCPVPPYVKPLSVVLGLLRLVLFLLIVEFEVNAGRIKYGSEVSGLTLSESGGGHRSPRFTAAT